MYARPQFLTILFAAPVARQGSVTAAVTSSKEQMPRLVVLLMTC